MTQNMIDEVRTYWDRRPCNIRHSNAPVGSIEYFEQVEARKYFVEPHIPTFADFNRWRGKRVLELGCGIGTDAVNFARAGARYTAVELSSKSMELARRRFTLLGLQGTFYHGNIEELSSLVPLERYDLVYSFGVIHHTPRPERVIQNVLKYLGPDSEFRLMLYATMSWKNTMIAAGFDQPEAQSGCPIAVAYSREEVQTLLSGMEVFEYSQAHIFPYVVEKYVKFEYELQPWFKAMPKEMFHALERAFGWHGLIKARLPR